MVPNSREARAKRAHAEGCPGVALLPRTSEGTLAAVEAIRSRKYTSKAAKQQDMRDEGLGKLHCVLEHTPGGKIDEDLSGDIMHQFLQGITRQEGYHSLIAVEDCFPGKSWDAVNDARRGLALPKGQQIPYLEKPKRDGKANGAMALTLSAAETMYYAVNRCAYLTLPCLALPYEP